MKKRILSLVLVVVMLALTLTSCAYNFANDSMSNYVTFGSEEFDAFKEALEKLVIEDGDFTASDEKVREQKVLETIYNTIGKKADLENKKYEGSVGTFDILYYAYYCTANFEGADNVVLYASGMKEASAIKLQLGMSSTAGELDLAIMEALKDKDIKDYLYKTNTDANTELKAGDVVYVSYTYEYVGTDSKTVTVKATNEKMTLVEGDAFSDKIIAECQKVATKKDTFELTVDGQDRTYKNVVVDWVVESATELGAFEVRDFDDTKSVSDVNGTSRKLSDIKDGILTYHVYPVYFVETDELSAELVLGELIGVNLTEDVFDFFGDESYKITGEDGKEIKLSELVKELATLCASRDSAKTSLTNAEKTLKEKQDAVDKAGDNVTEAQKTALDKAKKVIDGDPDAENENDKKGKKLLLKEAQDAVDAQIEKVFTTGEDVQEKVIEEYKALAYDTLEDQYNNEIIENVAKEVWALIVASVKVNSLPEKAVNEAYDRILENHKYTFYTGENSSTKESYYKQYDGSFDAYLIATFAKGKTYEEALAEVKKDAEEAVEPIVQLYAVAEHYKCVITDAEYNEDFVKGNSSYEYYVQTYGETNVRTAYQFDKLLSAILEVETVEEGDDKGEMKDYVDNDGDGIKESLPFKNIKYTFKTEEEGEETED